MEKEIKLNRADAGTVGKIVAEKAVEMYNKGAMWLQGEKYISCADMLSIANKILKPHGMGYNEKTFFDQVDEMNKKKKSKTHNQWKKKLQ